MPSAADPPVIQAEHLAVGYGETVVLENLDFTVSRGDVFAILGGSGSGKSTLLRTVIGLQEPLHGSVRIAGAHPPRGGAPTYGVLFPPGALRAAQDLYSCLLRGAHATTLRHTECSTVSVAGGKRISPPSAGWLTALSGVDPRDQQLGPLVVFVPGGLPLGRYLKVLGGP